MSKKKKADGKLQPWKVLNTRELFHAPPWVRLYKDRIELPDGDIVNDFYRVQLPEYVMVFAMSDDGKILFERQYKHALGEVTLALPTGCIEDGESHFEAVKRELLEETGYEAEKWALVGSFMVDGNKGCGKAHFYIAKGLKKIAEPVENNMEESENVFLDIDKARKAIETGEIKLLATVALIAIATNPAIRNNSL